MTPEFRSRLRPAWSLPAATGVAIMVTLVTATMSELAQRRSTVLGELVEALSTNVPTMHVWLEESIAGDPYVDVERDVFAAIDRAQNVTERNALRLSGPLRRDARAAGDRVRELGLRARQRLDTRSGEGKIASQLDQEFDAVYDDLLVRTEALRVAWSAAEREQLLWSRLLVLELVGCAGLAASLAVRARRLTRAIAIQNAELEERTNAARFAMALAEDASRAKGEFLASMSHEIRTPLNAVIGFAEVLSQSKLDPHQEQHVAMMRASGAHLLALVNDVLDFSKIEARELELEHVPFAVIDAVEDAVDLVAPAAHGKEIDLVTLVDGEVPRRAVGDRVRFRQIIVNLVANGVKFTDRGEVVIRVAAAAVDGAQATFTVTVHDTGTGIPAERLERLFRPFQQADASITRQRGGSGLGLSISKQLAERMGGTVTVTSSVGVGSDFVLEVPLDLDGVHADAKRPLAEGSRARALVVDGHESSRIALAYHLADAKIEAVIAADVPAAIALAHSEEPFGLAFVDERLEPEFSKDLSIAARMKDVPLVRLTAGSTAAALAGPTERAALTLIKPIRQSRVRETLATLATRIGGHSGRWGVAASGLGLGAGAALDARVLVVDDNAVNLELARALFTNMGVEVAIASSAAEGMALAEARSFEIVLLDLHMPVVDGISCARELKTRMGERCPRLIALTADVTEKARQACREAGFESVLTKPIAAGALATLVTARAFESERDLDASNLEILFSSDAARARRTCSTFVASAEETELTLAEACKARDYQAVVNGAHSLIGAAGSIGAIGLHRALKRLEAAARDRADVELESALVEVRERSRGAKRAVASWVSERS